MEKYFGILRKCPLFFGISDESLERMLNCLGAKIEFYDKKNAVFTEGDSNGSVGILLSGTLQIERVDYYGNRSIISIIKPSQTFGESFVCAGLERMPVSAVATAPSFVMRIDCSHILKTCHNACSHHHSLIYNMVRSLSETNVGLHEKAQITAKRTTREKLLAYLYAEVKKCGKNSFSIPFDRQELADYLEVDRSGLSAEISKLRAEGVLESSKRRFRLL